MTRRSAFAIAGGVVGAVVSTVAAYSIGLQARTQQFLAARASAPTHQSKPIVRTRRRTVTVHRKAGSGSATHNIVHVVPPPAPSSGSIAPAAPAAPATTNTGGSHPGGAGSDDELERGDD